jgi:DNA-damage-inducible protein J
VQSIDFFVQTTYTIFISRKGDGFMAGSTTNISIRMDSDLKAQADALFGELGMNLSTAFNIFVRQSLREGRIPFDISLNQPNKETIAAMLEAERIAKDPSVKGYTDLDELFADLKA